MKILLFTLEYPPFKGGVANYYENLVKHWKDADDIFVLADKTVDSEDTRLPRLRQLADPRNDSMVTNYRNVSYRRLLCKIIYPRWIFSMFVLWGEIRRKKIDHIIVGQLLPLGTATFFLTRIIRKKYTVVLHGMDFTFALKRGRKKFITKCILKNSHKIICGNSYLAGMVKDFLGEKYDSKISIVNPGVNPAILCDNSLIQKLKDKHSLNGKKIMLSLGRMVKRKGFDNAIEAMKIVNESYPELYYVLAGEGPDNVYIKDKGRGVKNLIFLGNLTEDEKWAWMCACDFFSMPARNIDGDFEGFGIVYLEANLVGKPVIAGNSGGVGDAVLGAKTGIMVNPEKTEDIANAIMRLVKDDELRKILGDFGRERVLNEFNWTNQVNKIYKLINNE